MIALLYPLDARALFERVISTFPPDRARPLWERWARHEYQYGDLAAAQKLEKRMAEAYPNGKDLSHSNSPDFDSWLDPPIKRFAQRHTYHSTDAIAARDLGVAIVRQTSGTSSSSSSINSLGRTDTQTSFLTSGGTPQPTQVATAPPVQHVKRPPSPDHKRRDSDSHGPAQYKRARATSPPGRDRDRWDGHGSGGRKRYNSPSWDRDRDRDAPPPPRRAKDLQPEEEKIVSVPSVISWFIGTLPGPSEFDGQ